MIKMIFLHFFLVDIWMLSITVQPLAQLSNITTVVASGIVLSLFIYIISI